MRAQWTRKKLEEAIKMRPESYEKLDLDNLQITFATEIFDAALTLVDDGFGFGA